VVFGLFLLGRFAIGPESSVVPDTEIAMMNNDCGISFLGV